MIGRSKRQDYVSDINSSLLIYNIKHDMVIWGGIGSYRVVLSSCSDKQRFDIYSVSIETTSVIRKICYMNCILEILIYV